MDSSGRPKIKTKRGSRGRNSHLAHLRKFIDKIKTGRIQKKLRRKISTCLRKVGVLDSISETSEQRPLRGVPNTQLQGMNGEKNGRRDNWITRTTKTKTKAQLTNYNQIGSFSREFSIAFLNTRAGVNINNGRLYELVAEAEADHIGAIGLAEHREFFTEAQYRDTRLAKGWRWIRGSASRDGPVGTAPIGGIGLLLSPKFAASFTETVWISPRVMDFIFVSRSHTKTHILVVYSPPATRENKARTATHYELLADYIATIPMGHLLVCVGDFNATTKTDPPPHSTAKRSFHRRRILYSPYGEKQNLNAPAFRAFIETADLYPLNTRFRQPNHKYLTYYGPRNRTARLDYIMVRGKWFTSFRTVTTRAPRNISSDHKMLIARGKWRLKCSPKKTPALRRDYKAYTTGPDSNRLQKAFIEAFSEYFHFDSEKSLDQNCDMLVRATHTALNSAEVPFLTRWQRRCPWVDQTILQHRKARDLLKKRLKHRRSKENALAVADANKKLKEVYADAERRYIEEQSLLITEHWNNKRFDQAYKIMDAIIGRAHHTPVRIKGTTPSERNTSWFNHFTEVFKQTVSSAGIYPLPFTMDPSVEFTDRDFTVEELQEAIQASQNGRACGEDGIPAELLKTPGYAARIVAFINQIYNAGAVPTRWKTLIIVPVPKKGDLTLPASYRGISLIDILAKCYNRLLLHRLRETLDRHLLKCQEGFRPGRSTTHHIVVIRELLRYVKSDKGLSLVMTFVDFNKAFDSVCWDYLQAILIAYRVPPRLVKAIMSMYVGANARIRTADGLTDPIMLGQGVLQGDTLAPYLFIIVMDWITRTAGLGTLHHGLRLVGRHTHHQYGLRSRGTTTTTTAQPLAISFASFADDGAITDGGAQNLAQTLTAAQASLSSFEEKSALVGLTINAPKTVVLACSQGKVLPAGSEVLRLSSGGALLTVRDFRYLGSMIAQERTDLVARLAAGWIPIRSATKLWKSTTLPTSTKLTFFKSLVVTVFLYGCESWIITEDISDRLRGAYTRMLRYIKGLSFADHPTIAEIYGDLPSIISVVTKRRLDFLGRAIRARTMRPTILVDVLAFLIQQYRKVPGTDDRSHNHGLSYIDQLYFDLDLGTGRPFRRNDFAALTSLADDVKAWDSMVKKRVGLVDAPAPIRPRTRARPTNLEEPARPSQNERRHVGRSPIRSTNLIRSFCRQLVLSSEDQALRESARARLLTDY